MARTRLRRPPDYDPAFTDADLAALEVLHTLIDSGFVDPGTEASIARAMGQSLSRLADWQTDMLADVLNRASGDDATPEEKVDAAMEAARVLLPQLRTVQDYAWRRHLAANADRLLASATAPGDPRELAVGFADLVGYTSRSRGMGGRELGRMVEDFESTAAEVIARHRGRVVKTVGDGVLFTAGTAVEAAEIGWTCRSRGTPTTGRRPSRHRVGRPRAGGLPPRGPGLPGAPAPAGVGAGVRRPAAVVGPSSGDRPRCRTARPRVRRRGGHTGTRLSRVAPSWS